ncbi:MAG: hypothetical protein U1E23_04045 [Reyranellaceae bacterium]
MTNYSSLPPDPSRDPRTGDRTYGGRRRGFGLLIGILVAIVLVGGVIYFASNRGSGRVEQAQAPISRTLPAPAAPDRIPSERATPAPPPADAPGAPATPR